MRIAVNPNNFIQKNKDGKVVNNSLKVPKKTGLGPRTDMPKIDQAVKVDISKKTKIPDIKTPNVMSDVLKTSLAKKALAAGAALSKDQAIKAKENDKKEIQKIKKNLKGHIKKPAVIFIGGMSLFGPSGDYKGVENMAQSVQDAKHFEWDEKNEILEQIKRHNAQFPVILVGHSLGGDTAVQVAKELNSLEHGFRRVDLLVTMDSVGLENDIIPQNVRKNLNFFGEKNAIFNDAPNVARNIQLTDVLNELRPEFHTELDDSNEIQFKILSSINELI